MRLYDNNMCAWITLLGCMFSGYLINIIDARPLHSKSPSSGTAWSTAIAAQTSELLVPVVDIGGIAEQGPCQESAGGLIPLHYTVSVTPSTSAAGLTRPAKVQTAFPPSTRNNQPTLQPCLVVQHQGAKQSQVPKERMRSSVESQNISYTAYFRAMPRDLCGTMPKVVIAATIQPEHGHQQPAMQTAEVDIVPWGCAYLIGDAASSIPAVSAGMPGPKMQAAAANAPEAADTPVLM